MYQTKEAILSAVEALMKEIPCDKRPMMINGEIKKGCQNCVLGLNNCNNLKSIRHNLINDLKTK